MGIPKNSPRAASARSKASARTDFRRLTRFRSPIWFMFRRGSNAIYPDVFCAALLNSQPMGFYAPAQLVRDAREHGVEIRPIDVNHSHWETTLEPLENSSRYAVRLGLQMVSGLPEKEAKGAGRSARRLGIPFAGRDRKARRMQPPRDGPPGASRCVRIHGDRTAAGALESQRARRKNSPAVRACGCVRGTRGGFAAGNKKPGSSGRLSGNGAYAARTSIELSAPPLESEASHNGCGIKKNAGGKIRSGGWAGVIPSASDDGEGNDLPDDRRRNRGGQSDRLEACASKYHDAVYHGKLLACRGIVQREGQVLHVIARQVWDWSAQLKRLDPEDGAPAFPCTAGISDKQSFRSGTSSDSSLSSEVVHAGPSGSSRSRPASARARSSP